MLNVNICGCFLRNSYTKCSRNKNGERRSRTEGKCLAENCLANLVTATLCTKSSLCYIGRTPPMVKCQKIVNLMAIVVARPEASDDQEEDGQSR